MVVLTPGAARAWQCLNKDGIHDTVVIALCRQGACAAGFTVGQEITGPDCRTIPDVRPFPHYARVGIPEFAGTLGWPDLSGIYRLQIDPRCNVYNWRSCFGSAKMTRLSESVDRAALSRYQGYWLAEETRIRRERALLTWTGATLIVALVLAALAQPWLLRFMVPFLRRRRAVLLATSISVQCVLIFAPVYVVAKSSYVLPRLWLLLAEFGSLLIVLMILAQIGYAIFLVWRRLKGRANA